MVSEVKRICLNTIYQLCDFGQIFFYAQKPQFPALYTKNNSSAYLTRLLKLLNKDM